MMADEHVRSIAAAALLVIALVFVLILNGAVPFVALPTLGQAVWTTGFGQSFLNDSMLSASAANFGAPEPAPISFGLAGAWLVSVFIACGLHPADAYATMVAVWLSIAFFGAYRLARAVSATHPLATLSAVLWLTLPIVWAHAEYSMLSLGIALLPLCFMSALRVLTLESESGVQPVSRAAGYGVASLIAVFMNGYSFVMFAVGCGILLVWMYARYPSRRRALITRATPVMAAGVALASLLYALYVGVNGYESAPLDAFRAWGVDLTFLVVPTQGIHWVADALGLSVARSEDTWFGDASVWRTTFTAPLLGAALLAWWRTRRTSELSAGLAFVLIIAFYLALGPSLKIDSRKPAHENLGQGMPARLAIAPTGSAWLSATLPGFRDMRSSYRWLALSAFAGWLLLIILLSSSKRADRLLAMVLAGGIVIVNLPNIPREWDEDLNNRRMFMRIDADLLDDMARVLRPRERIAFLPFRNDFLVNYVAARLDIVAYNIGGDKNLERARRHWPATLRNVRMGAIDETLPMLALLLLADNDADSIILPYVDLLWAAHRWPAPDEFKETLTSVIEVLRGSRLVDVTERAHYAVVRLNAKSQRAADTGDLAGEVFTKFCMSPVCLRQIRSTSGSDADAGTLGSSGFVRSGGRAVRHLGPDRPVAPGMYRFVLFGAGEPSREGQVELVSRRGEVIHARVAIPKDGPTRWRTEGILAEGYAAIRPEADDLAIRIVIGEREALRIDGYELVPVRGAKRLSRRPLVTPDRYPGEAARPAND